jgi:RNA polymerase sigma factor (sigma-70 family)
MAAAFRREEIGAWADSAAFQPIVPQPSPSFRGSCIMMRNEPGDYELALRAQQGDRDALAELVARTRLRLFALAYAELRHYDDAHDAVAAALLRICRHVKELREPERVREWMNRIVRNEARRLRSRVGSPPLSLEEADGCVETASLSLLRLDIERAMWQLPEDEAHVSRLFYLDDLSIAEIARRTGRPEGTIKSWLHRGRRRLAAELEEYAPMKRREALKLLAATPVLATTLEDQTSMATTPTETVPQAAPSRVAAIVHTDLKPALIRKLTEALRAGGCGTRVLTPTDPALLLDSLKEYQAIILDEWIGGRPALEFLMHLRARPDTWGIPVGLLCSDPAEFTVSAYFAAGVAPLINKNHPDEFARLAERFERPGTGAWTRFREPARQVIFVAQEEAAALGENLVGPEHLLLGLTRVPEICAKILTGMGVSLKSIRDEILRQATRGQGNMDQEMQLTPRAKVAIELAYAEAWMMNNSTLGVEHLLIGLLSEAEGLAAQVLVKLGVTLERARAAVQGLQAA